MNPYSFVLVSIMKDIIVAVRNALHTTFNCEAICGKTPGKGFVNHVGPKFRSAKGAMPDTKVVVSLNKFMYFMKRVYWESLDK